jgi:hypothetical protein
MKFNRIFFIDLKVLSLLLIYASSSLIECSFLRQNGNSVSMAYNYDKNTESEKNNIKMHYTAISPKYVDKLTQQKIEKISAEAETIGSSINKGEYYDGSLNMIMSTGECEIYSSKPHDCVRNSHCGWCEDSKKCVRGAREGAVGQLCRKENFIYFNPGQDWDPLGQSRANTARLENNFDENVTFY